MTDAADQADQVCELNLKVALAAREAAARDVKQVRDGDDVLCVVCEEPIDPARVRRCRAV